MRSTNARSALLLARVVTLGLSCAIAFNLTEVVTLVAGNGVSVVDSSASLMTDWSVAALVVVDGFFGVISLNRLTTRGGLALFAFDGVSSGADCGLNKSDRLISVSGDRTGVG